MIDHEPPKSVKHEMWAVHFACSSLLAAVCLLQQALFCAATYAALWFWATPVAEQGRESPLYVCVIVLQAEISCMVLQFVSEDITQFEDRGGMSLLFCKLLLSSDDALAHARLVHSLFGDVSFLWSSSH
jgi:hypothetical protein